MLFSKRYRKMPKIKLFGTKLSMSLWAKFRRLFRPENISHTYTNLAPVIFILQLERKGVNLIRSGWNYCLRW